MLKDFLNPVEGSQKMQTLVGQIHLRNWPNHTILVCLSLGGVQSWSVVFCGRNEGEIRNRLKQTFSLTREMFEIDRIDDLKLKQVITLAENLWGIAPERIRGLRPDADTAFGIFKGVTKAEESIWKEVNTM